MELTAINCPNCGGKVHIEEGRTLIYCSYCGTQIHIDDGTIRIDMTQHYVDEARMRELELQEQQRIREEQAKLEQEKRIEAELAKEKIWCKKWLIILGIWIAISSVLMTILVAILNSSDSLELDSGSGLASVFVIFIFICFICFPIFSAIIFYYLSLNFHSFPCFRNILNSQVNLYVL